MKPSTPLSALAPRARIGCTAKADRGRAVLRERFSYMVECRHRLPGFVDILADLPEDSDVADGIGSPPTSLRPPGGDGK